jgi:hypothetical protein
VIGPSGYSSSTPSSGRDKSTRAPTGSSGTTTTAWTAPWPPLCWQAETLGRLLGVPVAPLLWSMAPTSSTPSCQPRWLCQDGANQAGRPGAPAHPRGARLVSELCPERLRESSDTGQVDRDLCCLPIEHDDDQGGVLVVASQGCCHPAVPSQMD